MHPPCMGELENCTYPQPRNEVTFNFLDVQ